MSQIPESLQFAQLDQSFAVQDYAPDLVCLRLTGVSERSFRDSAFNSPGGCDTFALDLSYSDLSRFVSFRNRGSAAEVLMGLLERRRQSYPHWWFDKRRRPILSSQVWPAGFWLEIRYEISTARTGSYIYAMFGEGGPTYVRLTTVRVRPGPRVEPVESAERIGEHHPRPGERHELMAFHVGQGMCALAKGSDHGVLFDAGAGTPIKRPIYQAGPKPGGFQNDLQQEVSGLTLEALVSHADSDHWRLLEWDPSLLARVSKIYLPAGVASLGLSSSAVKPKIVGLTSWMRTASTAGCMEIKSFRSQPKKTSDQNGKCLVTTVGIGGRLALFSGDYSYARMGTDANPSISALSKSSFEAVMVPHHGAKESAKGVVSPKTPTVSKAFFSAGNHPSYNHPTAVSLKAHASANFAIVKDPLQLSIVKHVLL